MTYHKDNTSKYDDLYKQSSLTGKSLRQLCAESGVNVQSLYQWKYEQKKKAEGLTVAKLVDDRADKSNQQQCAAKPGAVYATVGQVKLAIPYADPSELTEILGAIKHV